jgi:hypothetical protein
MLFDQLRGRHRTREPLIQINPGAASRKNLSLLDRRSGYEVSPDGRHVSMIPPCCQRLRMHQAYTDAGGSAEYLPPFGSDGHFLVDSADAIPLWAPLVEAFLDKHR